MVHILRWSKFPIQHGNNRVFAPDWKATLQVNDIWRQGCCGFLQVVANDCAVFALQWSEDISKAENQSETENILTDCLPPLLLKLQQELSEYFQGRLRKFSVPLGFIGTEKQVLVWRELQQIPYAKTCSYQSIAEKLACPYAVRAVANAIARNPLHILIACHRVIAKNGKLCGYAGGLERKIALLALEKQGLGLI